MTRSVPVRCCAATRPGSTSTTSARPWLGGKVHCQCGQEIGIDKGTFIKMVAKGFAYKGSKRTS